jgi:surface antigen
MIRLAIAALILACAASPALAQNWIGLLKNTPAERFDEEDLRLFMDSAQKALDSGKENETLNWENPKTRARGDMTVTRNFESKGRPCRELHVRNEVPGRKGDTKLNFCQVEGKWRLLSAQQKK